MFVRVRGGGGSHEMRLEGVSLVVLVNILGLRRGGREGGRKLRIGMKTSVCGWRIHNRVMDDV